MATKSYQPPRTGFGGQGQRKASPKNETAKKAQSPKIQGSSIAPTPTATFYDPKANAVLGNGNGTGQYGVTAASQPVGSPSMTGSPMAGSPGAPAGGTPGAGMGMGYSPMGFAQTAYNRDPQVQASYVLNLLNELGLSDNPAIASMGADAMNPAQYNFLLSSGGQGDMSDAAFQAYLNNYLTQYFTPGGALPNSDELVRALLATDAGSPVGSAIGYGIDTPENQAGYANAFLQSALYGMNPLFQRAALNANDATTMQYYADAQRNPAASSDYSTYLRNSPLAKWYGG